MGERGGGFVGSGEKCGWRAIGGTLFAQQLSLENLMTGWREREIGKRREGMSGELRGAAKAGNGQCVKVRT